MEKQLDRVVSSSTPAGAAEERILRADLVREMLARARRGEGAKRIARELGVDRKTVKRWLRLGAWQPRRHQPRPRPIDGFVKFIEQRGPEVRQAFRQLRLELIPSRDLPLPASATIATIWPRPLRQLQGVLHLPRAHWRPTNFGQAAPLRVGSASVAAEP
jgi:hypothetical protein